MWYQSPGIHGIGQFYFDIHDLIISQDSEVSRIIYVFLLYRVSKECPFTFSELNCSVIFNIVVVDGKDNVFVFQYSFCGGTRVDFIYKYAGLFSG